MSTHDSNLFQLGLMLYEVFFYCHSLHSFNRAGDEVMVRHVVVMIPGKRGQNMNDVNGGTLETKKVNDVCGCVICGMAL